MAAPMAAPMDPVAAPMDPIEVAQPAPVLAPTIPPAGPLKAPMDTQPAPAQVTYRGFGDPVAEREAIYQHALLGLQGKKLGNDQVHLEVLNPHYKGTYEPRVRDAKKAVLEGGTLQRRLYGTVRLTDTQTGQLLDEQETVLAHIPHMNQRGLFVRNGTEWLGRGQQRLRSGIYGRKASDGSTQVQVNARRGRGFLLALEPESGLFKINVGQSTTRLYPVLRALGVSDDALKAKWGDELFKKNWRGVSGNDQKDLTKLVAKLGGPKDQQTPPDQLTAKLHEILGRTEIDPEVSEATTGRAISRLSHEELLHLTDKVLKTARGETPEDNRDSQAYQSAHGAEDFIRERLERDRAGSLRKLLWRATRERSLKGLHSGLLTPNIDALFQGSGLFVGTEDINPLEIHDLRHGLIRTGEGGMSPDAVSRDARNVQTSYLGFIDPSRTPDCYDSKTLVMTRKGWIGWTGVTMDTELATLQGGQLVWAFPSKLHASHYEGPMYQAEHDQLSYCVTPNHRMYVRPAHRLLNGAFADWRIETPEQVTKKVRLLLSGGFAPYVPAKPVTSFTLPPVVAEGATAGARRKPPVGAHLNKPLPPIPINDWLEFLGWYLSEGSASYRPDVGRYYCQISQCVKTNPENVARIKALLGRLPFAWTYRAASNAFTLSGKQLVSYLHQFGYCQHKYIPDYVFEAPVEARKLFVEALLLGDGRKAKTVGDRRTLCTVSQRLAHDFARLMFGLGRSVNVGFEHDGRAMSTFGGCWAVYMHTRDFRQVRAESRQGPIHSVIDYKGMVYCATVPGGLLYVCRNGKPGFWCGNSAAIGLDLRVTGAALKGSDNKLYTPLRNVRTGKTELLPALPLEKKVVAFPGEMAKPGEWVHGVKAGQLQYVKKSEVEYELPGMSSLLNPTTRLIPDPGGMKSQRLLMGTRMTGQAMPLEDPEAPLIQSANDDGTSLHSTLGKVLGAVHAKGPGVVQSVTPDAITIKYQDGHTEEHDLYNNYAHSRKTMSHNTPVVKPGDPVGANQLIARSNFTDKNGQMALGRNLRAGWMMAKGHTFEDSFVISESAAKKLTSQHLYQHDLGLDDIQTTRTSDYQQIYGPRFKRDQYAKLGDDGVIKVGQEVQPGDPLILGVGKKPLRAIGAVMQTARSGTSDRSEVWGHQAPGIVTDVAHGKDGIKVTVRSYNVSALSDKVSDRFGAKGVISKIVPDHKMPHDEQGRPLEILINANGIVSRGNPATLANAVLGKVAEKTGNPYVIQPFANHGKMTEFALEEARKHGVKILEDLTDPETGKKVPGVQTGIQYVMKLHHVAESKVSARDQAAYDIFGAPAKGGETGAKHMGGLELNTLLSHGATGFIKDAKLVRGQRNEDYWRALRHGDTPLTPGRSFANEHFQELLRAAGVNLRHEGTRTKLAPMLDHDVLQRAPHEIQSAETFDWKTMRPIPGGLFDPKATGGADGTQWGRIALGAKIPHPLFEIPVIKLLGITRKSLDEVLAGREQLHGKTGPEAIEAGLKAISTDRETERLKQVVRQGAQTKRDDAVKALGYLAGLKKMGLTPDQLMISQIPVLPPKFRPIARTDKMDITHDLNYLYGDLLEARKNHQDTLKTVGQAGDQYLTMYRAAKAVSSMYGPVGQKSAEQGVKGVLGFALGKGESPKGSVYHRRVLGNSLDTVGRGAITAAPELDMDQVRLPPRIAWPAFRPYVIRKLVQSGLSAQEAVQHVKDKTHRARLALDQVMGERPVVYNRAPSLHRYSSAGAWSTLGPDGDDSIGMNYVTEKNLGADHDGNCIVGSSKILIELECQGVTLLERAKSAAEEYNMKLSASTNVIAMTCQGIVASIPIRDVPHLAETTYLDSNGGKVSSVPLGVRVLSVGSDGVTPQWAPVTTFTEEEGCDLRKVTTSRGKEVTCSANESLAVYGGLGELVRVRPDDAVGHFAPVVKRFPATGTQYTWEFGWLVGAFLSDGWTTRNQIGYTKANFPHRERFLVCLGGVLGEQAKYRSYTATHEAATNSGIGGVSTKLHVAVGQDASDRLKALHLYLSELFDHSVTGREADERSCLFKRLPQDLFQYSPEALLGLLAGLMDGDGCLSVSRAKEKPQVICNFATSSPWLRDGLKLLGKLLGIRMSSSACEPNANRVQTHTSYTVSIAARDFGSLLADLNLLPTPGGELLAQTWEAMGDQIDIVPVSVAALDEARKTATPPGLVKRLTALTYEARKKSKELGTGIAPVTRLALVKLAAEFPESRLLLPEAFKLADEVDVHWERIATVEPAPTEVVFDLGVPDTKVFALENGLVVYDTLNVHIPNTDEAVKDVIEKLMPSKNLLSSATGEAHFEPQQDYVVGLHLATRVNPDKPVRKFVTRQDAERAYRAGEITLQDPIEILQR